MQYQRSWLSLYTGTSTTRSTWSLRWPACSSLRSSTAGRGAWSSAAMPSNLYWGTTPSSRRWPRKACTSLTRTDWSPRGIWPARLYTWWAEMTEYMTENIPIVPLLLRLAVQSNFMFLHGFFFCARFFSRPRVRHDMWNGITGFRSPSVHLQIHTLAHTCVSDMHINQGYNEGLIFYKMAKKMEITISRSSRIRLQIAWFD